MINNFYDNRVLLDNSLIILIIIPVIKKANSIPYGFKLFLLGLLIDKLNKIVPIIQVIIPIIIDSIIKIHIEIN